MMIRHFSLTFIKNPRFIDHRVDEFTTNLSLDGKQVFSPPRKKKNPNAQPMPLRNNVIV